MSSQFQEPAKRTSPRRHTVNETTRSAIATAAADFLAEGNASSLEPNLITPTPAHRCCLPHDENGITLRDGMPPPPPRRQRSSISLEAIQEANGGALLVGSNNSGLLVEFPPPPVFSAFDSIGAVEQLACVPNKTQERRRASTGSVLVGFAPLVLPPSGDSTSAKRSGSAISGPSSDSGHRRTDLEAKNIIKGPSPRSSLGYPGGDEDPE